MKKWYPVTEKLKNDPEFTAIGRELDGEDYIFWDGGGDWIREITDKGELEPSYEEDICFPKEYKPETEGATLSGLGLPQKCDPPLTYQA
jgi:hypothetical protein